MMLRKSLKDALVQGKWSVQIIDEDWAILRDDLCPGRPRGRFQIGHIACMNALSLHSGKSVFGAAMDLDESVCGMCYRAIPESHRMLLHLKEL